MPKKIVVVGLGEVGSETFQAIFNRLLGRKDYQLVGCDINPKALEDMKEGELTTEMPLDGDIYLVCVYTENQVREVMAKIPPKDNRLVVIESTISIPHAQDVQSFARRDGYGYRVAAFPHRFNPNDPAHHVFNIPRILGAIDSGSYEAAAEFYNSFNAQIYRAPDLVYACATKLLENSYRFAEIVLAQEFTVALRASRLDAAQVIELANTKWNISIKEARDGVGGKCLPKDIQLFNAGIKNEFIDYLIKTNDDYKSYYAEREKAMRRIGPVVN